MAGIVLASVVVAPALIWFALAFVTMPVAILLRFIRPQWKFAYLLLPGFLLLGAARYQMVQPPVELTSDQIAYYNETPRRVYVTGVVTELPDVRDTYMNLRIDVRKVDTGEGDKDVTGTLLVKLTNEYDVVYGDLVRVRGFIRTPSENEEFSYRDYLAMQDIYSTLRTNSITILPSYEEVNPFWAYMYRIKVSMIKRVYMLFPDPEASLLAGILFGFDSNIPKGVQQAFKNTGTAHIIAISGFNIAIIAGIFVTLFSRFFGKKLGAVLAILSIIFYTLLVGASASVVRAAIMGTLSIVAGLFGRRNWAMVALAASALIMALINPFVLWDIGFQLSFAATLGLVLYAQPMQDAVAAFLARYLPSPSVDMFVGPFSDYFLLTFAAQITTLPVIIYHFGRLSLVSFIANPVVLPPQPIVMILSGLAVAASKVYMPLGQVLAWIAWPFAAYTIRMVEFFSGIPGGVMVLGEFSLLAVIVFYAILLGATFAWERVKGIVTPMAVLSVLFAMTFVMWRSVLNVPDGRLHVTFLNVGSADGILIRTPSGKFILVSGGESPSALADQLGRRIPPFNRGIDYLVVASTQENQVAALPRVLEQYQPKKVLWAGNPEASFSSQRLIEWLTTNDIKTDKAKSGEIYDLGDGSKLTILAVSARGAILSVERGSFKVILPVGVDFDTLTELENGPDLGPVTALLLSESGYAPSNPPEWLAKVKPDLVVISVKAGDPNGLPSADMLEKLSDFNVTRTDANGWIDLSSDGKQVWVTVENK